MKPGLFIFDLETSGLDPARNSILQAAWMIVRDGMVLKERCMDVHPEDGEEFCLEALDVNGFELSRIRKGKTLAYVLNCMKVDLQETVKGSELLRPCGHNVQFDISFILGKSRKYENLSSYIDFRRAVDTLSVLRWMDYNGDISLENYRLETVCRHFKIPVRAHDAMEDVRAVQKLLIYLKG